MNLTFKDCNFLLIKLIYIIIKNSTTRRRFNTSLIISVLFLFSFLILSCKEKPQASDSNVSKSKDSGTVDQCYDLSNHKVSFITTAPGVSLEVLDWGGKGNYLVLLTGLGDNAHVFDNFAYQFTDLFHVIGITRRGFGKSSKPQDGYDEATRVRDYISIIDQLKIPKASFIGHSIACGELNYLGSHYQDRINKLVYLDGLDYSKHKLIKQPPTPDFTEADLSSLEHFMSVLVRYFGYREPNDAICNIYSMDSAGRIVGAISPPYVTEKIVASSVPADYSLITAPVLGIFEAYTLNTRLPFYKYATKKVQDEYDSAWIHIYDWRATELKRFRSEIKNCRVIEWPDFYHYVFINKEADVAREVRSFLTE